jgi:cbb3-type cytochrome oxidase maturation protein
MFTASLIILTVMVTISLITVAAFSWAASNRQFDDLEDASQVIFDGDEPIGKPTDPAIPKDSHNAKGGL